MQPFDSYHPNVVAEGFIDLLGKLDRNTKANMRAALNSILFADSPGVIEKTLGALTLVSTGYLARISDVNVTLGTLTLVGESTIV